MIKKHWKQLLVTTYIIVVLVLSATARATSLTPAVVNTDLDDLQKRIAAVLEARSEPAVFSKSAAVFSKSEPLLKSFQDIGHFLVDNSNSKLVFISASTQKIYYVKCTRDLKNKINSTELYVVSGFNLVSMNDSESTSRPPQNIEQTSMSFLNSRNMIYVTGVEIQR
jgi:hypothetical protein